ncbi:hypothetical protein U0070_010855 [Myodes glareolus]|uniref:Uncharacterized protein n=1 Tax=Myodes glareolus TaxID=447135 RepID=A0AAW0H6J5_MYOGA
MTKSKLCAFYKKCTATEVAADSLDEEKFFVADQEDWREDTKSVHGCMADADFSLLNCKMMFTNIFQKTLNKKGEKPRTKVPRIQYLVTLRILQHKR